VAAHNPAQPLENGLVLLERSRHLIRCHPPVGVQTFGALFQLFPGGLFKRTFRDPGHDLGVAGPQADQSLGPEALVGGRADVFRTRLEDQLGFSGFFGFFGFSAFLRF